MSSRSRLVVYAVPYVLLSALQYQFAKDGLRFAAPITFMGIRYLVGAVAAFTIMRSFRPILNRDTVLLGVFTWSSTVLWIFGLESVSPAQSAVLNYTMPLFAIPLSAIILKERTSRIGWVGAAVGFAGVAIYGVALEPSGGTLVGALLTVGSAVFWGLYTIFYRKVRNQHAVGTVATQFLICATLFLVLMPVDPSVSFTPRFALDLGFVSLIGGVGAFLLWSGMARIERIGRLTTLAFAVPAVSIALQIPLTGIAPSLVSVGGVCLMFFGIYVSRIKGEVEVGGGARAQG